MVVVVGVVVVGGGSSSGSQSVSHYHIPSRELMAEVRIVVPVVVVGSAGSSSIVVVVGSTVSRVAHGARSTLYSYSTSGTVHGPRPHARVVPYRRGTRGTHCDQGERVRGRGVLTLP